jgi:predicted nucleic acid-binding protein
MAGSERVVAWDTWAFVETALQYRRSHEVETLWESTSTIVTARDIIGETYTFILGKTRNTQTARLWLEAASQSRIRIVDPSMEDIIQYIQTRPEATRLSWPDMALAMVAEQAGTSLIATDDEGFSRLGLRPAFATPP